MSFDITNKKVTGDILRSIETAGLKLGGVPALCGHLHGTKSQLGLMSMSPE